MTSHALAKRGWLIVSAAVLGVGLAATGAFAQEVGYYGPYPNAYAGPETVYVYPPWRPREYGRFGVPLENVTMQRPVSYADLDLRTPWGARELVRRAGDTARNLCWRISYQYPVSTNDSPPCFRTAMEDVMPQIDDAIARARGGYPGY